MDKILAQKAFYIFYVVFEGYYGSTYINLNLIVKKKKLQKKIFFSFGDPVHFIKISLTSKLTVC